MPQIFKNEYPNTRIIIDANELIIEHLSSLLLYINRLHFQITRTEIQSQYWYVGITPSGVISFVSQTYEGSISDRKLVEISRLLEMLEPGNEADRSSLFKIYLFQLVFG